MLKLISEKFWMFQALEYEAVAMACKDPAMREIWRLTAEAWRQADETRSAGHKVVEAKSPGRADSARLGVEAETAAT